MYIASISLSQEHLVLGRSQKTMRHFVPRAYIFDQITEYFENNPSLCPKSIYFWPDHSRILKTMSHIVPRAFFFARSRRNTLKTMRHFVPRAVIFGQITEYFENNASFCPKSSCFESDHRIYSIQNRDRTASVNLRKQIRKPTLLIFGQTKSQNT